ncbi:hypothetical protein [Stieleria sp.]|uniref:hypothetical protein n=1 Tax=Stieleria sp. TaxID=2795976 RepID=UPI003562555D
MINRLPIFVRALTLLAIFSIGSNTARGGIINGDFSTALTDPAAGWATTFGLEPPVTESEQAKFVIDSFSDNLVQLEQEFLLPAGATSLSFDYQFLTESGGFFDPFFGAPPFDIFQASLLDPVTLDALISIDPSDDRFFGIDADRSTFSAIEVDTPELLSNGFTRISLDVSSLASQSVLLDFLFLGEDDGLISTVLLDNVTITTASTVVPEPGALAVWVLFSVTTMGGATRRRRRL